MLNTCAAAGAPNSVVWVPYGSSSPSRATPGRSTPAPATVGAQAASQLGLPGPVIGMDPGGTGYVQVPEWLWVSPAQWHPYRTGATACGAGGCVGATATAVPVAVTWTMGDGASVVCHGPGVVYDPTRPAAGQATYCSHTYARSSAGQPGGGAGNAAAYRVTATVTWVVTWSASTGEHGQLPDVHTSATTSLRVEQIEAVRLS